MLQWLQSFDVTVFTRLNGVHHPVADFFFLAVTNLGNAWMVAPLLVALILYKVPRSMWLRVFICGVAGLTLSGILNSEVKREVRRMRPVAYWKHLHAANVQPDTPASAYTVHQIGPDYSSRSFPSGHTNTAFAAATFCALLFGGRFLFAYGAAVLVGYSRIYLGVHFPFDVAVGALLGSGIMALVVLVARCKRIPPKVKKTGIA